MQAPSATVRDRGPFYAKRVIILVCTGAFMGALDSSIVNVAYPTLTGIFRIPVAEVGWIGMAYLMVATTLMTIAGRLSDQLGHKRIYLGGFLVFLVGSALCGTAWSFGGMIGFRVLQAIGSAMITANGVALLRQYVPAGRLGMAFGLWEASVSVAMLVGPVIGGMLIQVFSWRWIFYVNVPVGLIAMVMAQTWLPLDASPRRSSHFDIKGSVAFGVGLGGLLAGLTVGSVDGWGGGLPEFLTAAGIVGILEFLFVESSTEDPMMDLALFHNPVFTTANVSKIFAYATMFSMTFLIPFFLEQVIGLEPGQVGRFMLPFPVAMAAGSLLAGPLSDRVTSRMLAPFGMAVATAGLILFTRLTPTGLDWFFIGMAAVAFGLGIYIAPNDSIIMQNVSPEKFGLAGGILAMMRSVGMICGIAFASSAIQMQVGSTADIRYPAMGAFLHAYHNVYRLGALIALTGLAITLVSSRFAVGSVPRARHPQSSGRV